jgi:festuclavine dehydrogenase
MDDIVDVALSALLDQKSHNTDHYIVGPQLLSYTEVCSVPFSFASVSVLILRQAAGILSQVLDRPIKHKALPPDAYRAKLIERFGVPPLLASVMVGLNGQIAAGEDSKRYHSEKVILGKRFISDWFEENKAAFIA